MLVYLIRHGQTRWNVQGRYLGLTDMPLSDLGVQTAEAAAKAAPDPQLIFCSPLLRCKQTADIMFPDREKAVIEDLHECNFGNFEGRTADEMEHDSEYRRWVASGCSEDIPGGESIAGFHSRVCNALEAAVRANSAASSIAFVVHGGVIMSLLHRFNVEHHEFYDYKIQNCAFITCECSLDGDLKLKVIGGSCL